MSFLTTRDMNAQLYGIALLRVSSRPSEQAVKISFATPEKGDFVTVIHFPIGRPDGGISFGAIAAVQGNHVFYDASTEGGSSGGPVLDRDLRLVAMHVAGPVRSKDYLDSVRDIQFGPLTPCHAVCHSAIDVLGRNRELSPLGG